jgi:ABC-2 type transport system ATP-binding protein
MTPARADGVARRYGEVLAVDDVSLRVRPGEVLGLLGANGAGKTTFIRLLLGLERPTSGRVELFGGPPNRESRRRVGYVPQGLGLYEDLSVRENLAFAGGAFGSPPPQLDPELEAASGVPVGDLPLGLQRRLAFVQALAHDPDLLVLDEPTSGVDPLARARLWDRIREAADDGAGVLVTTHYMEEAEQCDRLVVLSAGSVVAQGTLEDILGGATTVVVRTERWDEAFAGLEAAGLEAALVGRSLRISDADPERVREALEAAGLSADVETAPATFEERFVALSAGTIDR